LQSRNTRVGNVAAEQVRRYAVGHTQGARQDRSFALFKQHQVLVDQRSAGGKPAAGVCPARGESAQFEPEANAGASARHIILQIPVEPLETGVDVGRHGNQQQLDVDLIETEIARQAAQSQIGPLLFGGIGGGFDFLARCRRRRVGCSGCRPVGQQPIDVGLRNVEPTKPVIGFRIGCATSSDRSPDACLDQLEPPQDMDQRRVGDRSQRGRRHRLRSG
jgi:hypothetical protein